MEHHRTGPWRRRTGNNASGPPGCAARYVRTDEIGELDEELAGVVVHVIGTDDPPPDVRGLKRDVLQVPVVPDVERRPGVHEVREKDVGVEVPPRLQPGQRLIRDDGVVLQDDAQGQLRVELPVPAERRIWLAKRRSPVPMLESLDRT